MNHAFQELNHLRVVASGYAAILAESLWLSVSWIFF
jgi:hypothetical protein